MTFLSLLFFVYFVLRDALNRVRCACHRAFINHWVQPMRRARQEGHLRVSIPDPQKRQKFLESIYQEAL